MENISARFIECYKFLLSKSLVKNSVDFAKNIGISTSMMTEIAKGRSNVGLKAIQNTVIYYPVSAEWLIAGRGEMLTTASVHEAPSADAELSKKDEEIFWLKKQLEVLNETNKLLAENIRNRASISEAVEV